MKKRILTCVLIVLGFLVLAYAFVPEVLSGKIVNQSDISGWSGMAHEMTSWNAEHPDDKALWTESMFGGMPVTTISAASDGDWTLKVYNFFLTGKRPASYLFICLLGGWLLLLAFGVNPLIAAGGAIAIAFCSYNFQIIQVGHNTKMMALAWMPWVLAAVVFTYRSARRRKTAMMLLGAAAFALVLSFQVKANHQQISYYLAIVILLYVLAEFIALVVKKKNLGRFFAASFLLLALGLVGIGTNAIKLLPTFEYTPYSMRGGTTSTSGDGQKGLDLDYATAWSYGWEELPNLMIPNFNGGSSAGELGPSTETYKLLKQAGQPNLREVSKNMPCYWGPQPFTAGPMYMGAITIFLFLLGLLLYKGRDKWWILVATVLAILLALGNHFMAFTKFAFAAFPLYNKFRTVSMALVILQVTLPLLGFMALDKIVKGGVTAEVFRKKGWIALALTAGFCLLMWIFPGIAGSFTAPSDAGQPEVLSQALAADRRALLRTDALISGLFIIAAFALLWWGFAGKDAARRNRLVIAGLSICVLVLINMFATGKRYLSKDDFITPKNFTSQFDQRPVDKAILQDTDPSYRVLDLTVNVFNDSHPSYWHKNIGGYSPAKLQIYQEYIENHLQGEISSLYNSLKGVRSVQEAEAAVPALEGLSKLNCRYIILDGNAAPIRYPYAKGNAWFEASDSTAITMTSYTPNRMEYHYASPTGGKAVFSEVWYPAGWVLRLKDSGEVLPLSLSDEVLRSAVLPAGEHDLVMSYEPKSYARGEAISRICSIITLLLFVAAAVLAFMGWRKKEEA